MLKKNLKKNEYKALEDFKKALTQRLGGEILDLELFGSKARGDSHRESDIDVLIVLRKKSTKVEDFILDLTGELLRKYGVFISPIILSKKDYDYQRGLPSVFIQILQREGIPL